MSGPEVLGVIPAAISIIDDIKEIYEAGKDVQGLPEAFRQVASRLPLVKDILTTIENHLDDPMTNASPNAADVIRQVEETAKDLHKVFDKVMAQKGGSTSSRYYKIAKSLTKKAKVETLMVALMADVELLVTQHELEKIALPEVEHLRNAIEELSKTDPSIPESEFEQHGPGSAIKYIYSGYAQSTLITPAIMHSSLFY